MLPDDPDEVDESPVDRTNWPVVTSSEPEAPDVLSPVVTLIVPDDDVPCPEETSTSPETTCSDTSFKQDGATSTTGLGRCSSCHRQVSSVA